MSESETRVDELVLILRCQTGDQRAFEEIVECFSTRLKYYLLKLIGDRGTAEDVLQDVWWDCWRGVARLKEPASFRTWIYRVARNRAFQVIRRMRPEVSLVEEDALSVTDDSEPSFGEEDAVRIHQALETLTREHREVLVLRFIDDLSYSQIAEVTGCTVGTVKSRMHYAKEMLRRQIRKERT